MPNDYSNQTSLIELNHKNMTRTNAEIWLNDLMNEYGQEIIWLAYSYVRDKSTAEDLAQNAFLKCYQKIDTFKNDSSIKSWLYRITINCCKDYLRSSYFRRIFPTSMQQLLNREKISSTESLYFEKNVSSPLIDCVYSLPTKYREVIILYYFQELKIKEIKEILNLKENTIKTRMRKARDILRERLERGAYE